MSEDGSNRGILSPESMPVFVVVIGALALLAVSMNFYNWSLIQGVTGAAVALEHDAIADGSESKAFKARLDAVEKELAATRQALAEAQAKMASMPPADAEGVAGGGPE